MSQSDLPEGQPPLATGPASDPPNRPDWTRFTWAIPVVVLFWVFSLIHVPYFVLSPGPATDVEPRIHVSGHATYQSKGHLLLTSVFESVETITLYDAVHAWLSPAEELVPARDILAPGETTTQHFQVARSEMDTSKIDAAIVALSSFAGYPKHHGQGVLVEEAFPGTPADGKLFAGDLITSVDGTKIDTPEQVGALIRAAGTGHSLRFAVEAAGQHRVVSVAPAVVKGVDHPIIGVSMVANFPFPLTISSGDIGGPSAGLMWTLGVTDVLTPGDLTGGRTIAGTGTISSDGTVGPIGGVEEKVAGAERAGARIFLVPVANAADARAVGKGMVVVPVRTYQDALNYLLAHGGAVSAP
jgi:PDZ domain-containing protein